MVKVAEHRVDVNLSDGQARGKIPNFPKRFTLFRVAPLTRRDRGCEVIGRGAVIEDSGALFRIDGCETTYEAQTARRDKDSARSHAGQQQTIFPNDPGKQSLCHHLDARGRHFQNNQKPND